MNPAMPTSTSTIGGTEAMSAPSGSRPGETADLDLNDCGRRRGASRRRSSGVSFEKHGAMVFEELSKMVDIEDDCEDGDGGEGDATDRNHEPQGSGISGARRSSGGSGGGTGRSGHQTARTDAGTAGTARRSSYVSIQSSLASVHEIGDDDGDGDDEEQLDGRFNINLGGNADNNSNNRDDPPSSVTMRFERMIMEQEAERQNHLVTDRSSFSSRRGRQSVPANSTGGSGDGSQMLRRGSRLRASMNATTSSGPGVAPSASSGSSGSTGHHRMSVAEAAAAVAAQFSDDDDDDDDDRS